MGRAGTLPVVKRWKSLASLMCAGFVSRLVRRMEVIRLSASTSLPEAQLISQGEAGRKTLRRPFHLKGRTVPVASTAPVVCSCPTDDRVQHSLASNAFKSCKETSSRIFRWRPCVGAVHIPPPPSIGVAGSGPITLLRSDGLRTSYEDVSHLKSIMYLQQPQ